MEHLVSEDRIVGTDSKDAIDVALVEFSPVWEEPEANLAVLGDLFDAIFSGGVLPALPDMVVLPEFFAAGFTMNPELAEPAGSPETLGWMKSVSARYGCAVAGSVPVSEAGKRYNRMFFVQPDSGVRPSAHVSSVEPAVHVDFYDKAHLFFGGEEENYTPGTERKVFVFKGWRILPGICFDLRFPGWARNSGHNPYDLYLNIANWPVARNAAADTLIRARSVENVCWSLFCNRTGSDRLLDYSGNSAVIDFRGRSRGKRYGADGVPVLWARMEKAPMLRFREGFPILGKMDENINSI